MRQSWTDDRLDDLARRMDSGFAQVHGDIAALRVSQEACARADVVDRRFEALEARFDRFQATILGGFLSIVVALIALHFV